MYNGSQELTALISARICHDLASPLGAIANGLELLELTGLGDTPEVTLLSDSVNSATARIEFFRIAYGPANPKTLISPAIAQKTLAKNFAERKISINWTPVLDCPRPIAKLLFLLIQATETVLPYGGEVEVSQTERRWSIVCTARETRVNAHPWDHLTNDENADPLQSSQVQFGLARLQAAELDVDISYTNTPKTLTFTVS